MVPLHLIVASLIGWLQREQQEVIEYLREENRVLKAQLRNQRVRLTDDERRRLATLGARLGRRLLVEVATIVTPDTILRWHRQLIARKWTYRKGQPGRPCVLAEVRRLVVRMATENPSWGYTRIQGALKNLGHRVARSTIATILKPHGIPPSRERPSSWPVFLRAHWRELMAADFFTTEVWTAPRVSHVLHVICHRTALAASLHRRVHAASRQGVHAPDRTPADRRERRRGERAAFPDLRSRSKWSLAVRQLLETSGVRVIQTPFRAPNCNAHAERFVRSIKEECLNRLILLGERHLRRALTEFMAHYHRERNHQGLGNELIDSVGDQQSGGRSAGVSALVAFSTTTIVRRSAIGAQIPSAELLDITGFLMSPPAPCWRFGRRACRAVRRLSKTAHRLIDSCQHNQCVECSH